MSTVARVTNAICFQSGGRDSDLEQDGVRAFRNRCAHRGQDMYEILSCGIVVDRNVGSPSSKFCTGWLDLSAERRRWRPMADRVGLPLAAVYLQPISKRTATLVAECESPRLSFSRVSDLQPHKPYTKNKAFLFFFFNKPPRSHA